MTMPGRRQSRRWGVAGSPPTITSVTPNSVSKTGGVVTLVLVGTHFTGTTAVDVLDTSHGNASDGGITGFAVDDDSHIDGGGSTTYDPSIASSPVGATVIRVTTPYGTATKAFTLTA